MAAFADRPIKKLVLFDVDGTLTPARQAASPEIIDVLRALRKKVTIGFVGGSDLVKISEQLAVAGNDVIQDFDYAFAENGLTAYKLGQQLASQSFIKFIGEQKYKVLVNFILHYIADLDVPIKRGTFIEFRNGMINVSPVGRNATIQERHEFEAYDKQHGVRAAFVKVLQERFADYGLTYSIGGQISFDVFPNGWDKTYSLKHVEAEGFEEIHFFGDKTYKGGNDYEIYTDSRTVGHAVSSPADTIRILKELFLDIILIWDLFGKSHQSKQSDYLPFVPPPAMDSPQRETFMNATKSPVSYSEGADSKHTGSPRQSRAQHNRTPAPTQPQQSMGMSPMSRYNHNLKVLRRRDPSIVSIFDQFSHVCVYHHNGKKWEKQGFEGSMFLYDRESYPPYGFYILNRMGMEDYIHRLYPEDDIGAHGSYLMLRSYPDFTADRLKAIQSSHETPPDKFSDVYAVPNLDKLGYNDKGRSQTVGLWMFATDAREPMIDVMMRLHSFIKKNDPYPEEFRYGPGKPPPPNPHPHKSTASRNLNRVDDSPSKSVRTSQSYDSPSENELGALSESAEPSPSNGLSDLDKLFMKLCPNTPLSSSSSVLVQANVTPSMTETERPLSQSTSKMTVDSLFAALTGSDHPHPHPHEEYPHHPISNAATGGTTSNKTTSLLNSIFASATPASNNLLTTIYSPTPTTSSVPQVLSQDVLSDLLGLPHSRSASAASASSTYSTNAPSVHSVRSHPSSREGDDEDDGDGAGIDDAESLVTGMGGRGVKKSDRKNRLTSLDGGYTTMLDLNGEPGGQLQTVGATTAQPLLAEAAEGLYVQAGVNGDATPRPPGPLESASVRSSLLRMSSTSRLQGSPRIHRGDRNDGRASVPPSMNNAVVPPPPVELSLSTSTVRGSSSRPYRDGSQGVNNAAGAAPVTNGGLNHRPLVPFSADSELWPYPHPSTKQNEKGDDGEILELDFEETSALSDMNAFRKALQRGKERSRSAAGMSTSAGSSVEGQQGYDANGRMKGRRKTRKEREAERLREREQIENSWDTPAPVSNPPSSVPLGMGTISNARSSTPSRKAQVVVNGFGQGRKQVVSCNEIAPVPAPASAVAAVDSGLVKETLISTLLGHAQKPGRLERNMFVREVLTLIHTDKTFVDTLWKDYTKGLDA
ncbi:hypothetical protein AX17_003840 [Amanita inopinata Kibby_2008]|nr:hypothetical protein AX17_003840 [Amanita inopinata Kibby_2008]